MHKQLKKAINLSKKTGDRLIVYDMNHDDSAFVVMDLDEYEKLVLNKSQKIHDLTEDELLDKINRDIAEWKSSFVSLENIKEKSEIKPEISKIPEISDINEEIEDYTGRFDPHTLELKKEKNEKKKSARWKIPAERKENAEEVIEEDRQYLEEIEF